MRDQFTKPARVIVTRAEDEARDRGSRTIEAEHLLLAASTAVGLDRRELEAAFSEEWRASLKNAGVDIEPPAPRRYRGRVRFGASAKQALASSVDLAKRRNDRRIEPRHIAMGVVEAKEGTVPRALKRADVDTSTLWHSD